MIDVFQQPEIEFPKGFLFGASTAGQQIEGNCHSQFDCEEFYQSGPSFQPAGIACNSYELYDKDIGLLKELNLNAYRMSIEWSRIEPEQGIFDESAVAHYLRELEALKAAGIKVCLTLYHFAHPVWFERIGAFTTLNQIKAFARYIEYVVPKVEPYVDYWITINELNLPYRYSMQERLNLLEYHAAAYHIVKKYSKKPVSSALAYSLKMPYRGQNDVLDNVMAAVADYMENEFFLHAIRTGEICAPGMDGKYVKDVKDTCDFWAYNTYSRSMVDGRKAELLMDHPIYNATHVCGLDMSYHTDEIYPEVMVNALIRMRDKPCLITENGLATTDDRFRIVYIASMLQAIREAMDMGVEVWGYLHWSLLDNWEWGSYVPVFGLASVEEGTYRRVPKDSGRFLGDICKAHRCNREMIAKYLRGMPSKYDKKSGR